jgi:hypothetical protein
MTVQFHPVHMPDNLTLGRFVSAALTERAFEIHVFMHGSEPSLKSINRRGGLSYPQLIAYLYAYGFPREECFDRVQEALNGVVVNER